VHGAADWTQFAGHVVANRGPTVAWRFQANQIANIEASYAQYVGTFGT
jgi:hypothetical protein